MGRHFRLYIVYFLFICLFHFGLVHVNVSHQNKDFFFLHLVVKRSSPLNSIIAGMAANVSCRHTVIFNNRKIEILIIILVFGLNLESKNP